MICTCYVLWSQMLYFWFSQYKWLDSNKILIIYEHNSFCFFIAVILHHLFFTTYLLYTSSLLVVTSQLWSCCSLDHLWLVIVGVSKTMLCIYWCILCPEHCFTFTFTLWEFLVLCQMTHQLMSSIQMNIVHISMNSNWWIEYFYYE